MVLKFEISSNIYDEELLQNYQVVSGLNPVTSWLTN